MHIKGDNVIAVKKEIYFELIKSRDDWFKDLNSVVVSLDQC